MYKKDLLSPFRASFSHQIPFFPFKHFQPYIKLVSFVDLALVVSIFADFLVHYLLVINYSKVIFVSLEPNLLKCLHYLRYFRLGVLYYSKIECLGLKFI